MLRQAAAGLAALGLIGGVGSVVWHNGSATVKVKDANGVTHSTKLNMDGQQYSCPSGERDKVDALVEAAGRIKITLKGVNQYANPSRYNELVDAYNAKVDEYNSTLESDCEVT
jgi:hypothetical protein